jgi:hypothetical protein
MRKVSNIILAILLLLAGMHITVALHFCEGKLAATKVSITGGLASCGMASDLKSRASTEITYKSNCCENETHVYAVDKNYSTSEFHFKEIAQPILQLFSLPEGYLHNSGNLPNTRLTNVSPPDNFTANAVSMADICVFRI